MRFLAWLGHFLTRHEDTPPVEVITRDYEWQDQHACSSCKLTGRALFIEWLPDRVTTAECPFCGYEEEVAREEASPEAVDH